MLAARDTMISCAVVLLSAVLRTVACSAAEATPRNTSIVLSSMVILVAFKALCDVATAIKQLTVVELAVKQESSINK